MSAVETGQMSAVETRQMYSIKTGRSPVPILYICLSQQQASALSQQQTSVLSQQKTFVLSQQKTSVLSQQQILCVSETCSGRDTSKSPYLNNRRVTFQTYGTPNSRIAVRFQWAQSCDELLKKPQKWLELASEWSPGAENQAPSFPRA